MTITATATLTSSGSLTAPKLGDVLDYRVAISGEQAFGLSIAPSPVTVTPPGGTPVTVTPAGGPWTITIPDAESIPGPVVTGGSLTKPFAQDPADPHHWSATL